ncbi:DUF3344 domain-containing protein [Streptomyces sp. MRC013]|uniref:DUF3344 domain-containing protein n=1 Tax=Streptomyces sp. MRC013 TaxID=2898276 RepID=UPI002026F575|nr:DUF3344 domain-containing protein [Streptomyces sp. MRC013]URM90318.1 DUF3344 domain-containing protein [Streptomyces sp. MRC013]
MRIPVAPAVRRVLVCLLSCAALSTALPAAAAPRAGERPRIPFAQRYHAVQHGGLARAANSAVTCRHSAAGGGAAEDPCVAARLGEGAAANHQYDMFYADVDDDPNTFNSTRAELVLPEEARVTYARLYWGGNLRVGEQKPPKDSGRVLVAEPGGAYKEVLADSLVGHRTANGADAFHATADVTRLVRDSGPGMYTVAQINVAMGRTAVGAWGGWTLVVAYAQEDAPLRHLSLWDGFETLAEGRRSFRLDTGPMRVPMGGSGRLGTVVYDGDRGLAGDHVAFEPHPGRTVPLTGSANAPGDAFDSTVTDSGGTQIRRRPAHRNTLGYDSDVIDLSPALRRGASDTAVRLGAARDYLWLGALFLEADARV